MNDLQSYIDGAWTSSAGAEWIDLIDPTTETRRARQPAGSAADVDRAVAAARAAVATWAARPLEERIELLTEAADNLDSEIPTLARLEYEEMGKPIQMAEEFLAAGVAVLRASIEDACHYPFVEEVSDSGGIRTVTAHRPLGVIGQIIPWNFTVTATLLGLGPLLTSGNCVVLKPSEKAPLSALHMASVLDLPPGVFNVVLGDGRAGRALAAHPDIAMTHFTGSVAAGRSVANAASERLTRTVLELGGKDPVIVDADVDPRATAEAVAYGAFINSGQICTSMERIFVHRDVAQPFLDALVEYADGYVFGDGASPTTVMGPMVDDRQRQVVQRHVDDAVAKGATVLTGGTIPDCTGYFYPATVLTGVTSDMVVMREETFGPVAPVRIVDTFAEGLRLAAESDYGLAATVYTNSDAHADAALDLPVGMVWVNQWQGGGLVRMYEPAGNSGVGATGGRAAYDAATRAVSISHDSGVRAGLRV